MKLFQANLLRKSIKLFFESSNVTITDFLALPVLFSKFQSIGTSKIFLALEFYKYDFLQHF